MTAALNLPDRDEWTVEDLAELPADLPLHEAITLTELLLAPDRPEYDLGVHTSEIFTTDRPWPVTVDLPALTERRAAILGRTGRDA